MNAIETKYLGPTNTLGARVKATVDLGNSWDADKRSVTVSYDHALSAEQNHEAAAAALLRRMKWVGQWVSGSTPTGYVFVRISYDYPVDGAPNPNPNPIRRSITQHGPSTSGDRNISDVPAWPTL